MEMIEGAHAFVRAWILGLDLGRHRVHFGLRRGEAHAVFQATDDLPIATGTCALCLGPLHRPGGPQPDAARLVFEQARLKFIGRDADNVSERSRGEWPCQRLPDRRRVAAPDARAQDHDLVVALLVFASRKETAKARGVMPKALEEALGHVDGAATLPPYRRPV